ncbi:MAG TPA: hypothetical protein ENI46_03435 [Firmicutes bacterium]|nr:hypothetical protein [Bacillota bacterium]
MIAEGTAEAMKTAIEMEKSGHRFFTEASNKVTHEVGRKLFRRLASEEIDHLRTFERIFDELSKGGDWKQAISSVEPSKRMPYFDEARKEFKAQDLSVELDYLRRALEIERHAIEFFENAIANAETQEAKEVFTRILEEGKNHYDLIQAEIDSINHSGFWFDLHELRTDSQF